MNAINALQKYITQFDKKENFLRHQKWVAELIKDGKMENAMKRAESLGRSGASYTDVWKAIKEMTPIIPNEIISIFAKYN